VSPLTFNLSLFLADFRSALSRCGRPAYPQLMWWRCLEEADSHDLAGKVVDYFQARHNDGTYGWAAAPDVRTKWMQVPKVATYPEFLWSQPDNEIDGRVAGRKAVSSSQMPTGTVIFGRWSDAMIATRAGAEILVNPYVKAVNAEHQISLNLFVAVAFRHSSAVVSSAGVASQ